MVHRPPARIRRIGRPQRRHGGRRCAAHRTGDHPPRARGRQRSGPAVPQRHGSCRRVRRLRGREPARGPARPARRALQHRALPRRVPARALLAARSPWTGSTAPRGACPARPRTPPRSSGATRPRARSASGSSISSLADQWMPAAFEPVYTTVGNARVIPESATLIAPTSVSSLDYQVRSVVERAPTRAEVARTARPIPEARRVDLALPDSFPENRRRQALAITASAATPWDKAVALQQFFTDGSFTYDLDVRPGDGPSAIDEFLTTRRGFCQQFAAAFAALARASGLPSRVVVGFTPGSYDSDSGDYVGARPGCARVGRGVVRRARLAHVRADARRSRARSGRRPPQRRHHTERDREQRDDHRDHRADVGHHRGRGVRRCGAPVPRRGQSRHRGFRRRRRELVGEVDRDGRARRGTARRRDRAPRSGASIVRDASGGGGATRRCRTPASRAHGRTRSTTAAAPACRSRVRSLPPSRCGHWRRRACRARRCRRSTSSRPCTPSSSTPVIRWHRTRPTAPGTWPTTCATRCWWEWAPARARPAALRPGWTDARVTRARPAGP